MTGGGAEIVRRAASENRTISEREKTLPLINMRDTGDRIQAIPARVAQKIVQ
jgi:hypothetical protein